MMHTYTTTLLSLPNINFLHLIVSEIRPGQGFKDQGHSDKVKGQITATSPHCTPPPITNAPTKYQLPTPYGFQDMAPTRIKRSRSWGNIKSRSTMSLYTYTPNQCTYQVSNSYTLWFLKYRPDKIFHLEVITARSKVKSRSHNGVAQLHSSTNIPLKYQLPTPYSF